MQAKTQGKAILLLTGPPGSAKSSCFRAVCSSIHLLDQKLQWDEDEASTEQTADEIQSFADFLMRAVRYSGSGLNFKQSTDISNEKRMQAIVVEVGMPLFLID